MEDEEGAAGGRGVKSGPAKSAGRENFTRRTPAFHRFRQDVTRRPAGCLRGVFGGRHRIASMIALHAKPLRLVWGNPSVPGGRWHAGLVNLRVVPRTRRRRRRGPDATATTPATAGVATIPTTGLAAGPTAVAAAGAAAGAAVFEAYRSHRPHLSLRGALVWAAALALAVYLAGAAVLARRLAESSPHNRVGYTDLVLPWRWDELDRRRGEALVAQGREALAAGRGAEGFALMRAGLARAPGDHAARLELARLHLRLRLGPHAITLLKGGLTHGYPGRESLQTLLTLLRESDHAPDEAAELCLRARAALLALPEAKRPAGESRWLDQQTVRALVAADRAEEALALVEAGYAETDPFRREFTLARWLEEGRAAEARAAAERWASESPGAPEPLRLGVVAARQLGDHGAMDAGLRALRALTPTEVEPSLYAITQWHLAGREEAAAAELDRLILRHGADPQLYAPLALVLSELGRIDDLGRLERECAERGFPLRPVLWARLELAQGAGEWSRVLGLLDAIEDEAGRADGDQALSEAQRRWLVTARRLARACLDGGSGTQAALVEAVADQPGALPLYVRILEALLAAGRPRTAAEVLVLAEGPFPGARSLGGLRGRIGTALAAPPSPTAETRLAEAAAHPALPGGVAGEESLGSREAFLSALTEAVATGDDPAALALLGAVRRTRPAWLDEATTAEMETQELTLHARGDDLVRLQFLARSQLARDPGPAEGRLLALAATAHSDGHAATARLLVKEILRHAPEHPDALTLLRSWPGGE